MRRRHLWFAAVFAAVPALVFACGGRSDIDLLLEGAAGKAGAAGAAGKGGGGGVAGQSGQSGQAGQAGQGQSGSGGSSSACAPGQQIECACPGTALKGVQVCQTDGKGFGACTGCPGGGEGGSAGSAGSGGSGGKAGSSQAGQGGNPQGDGGKDFFDSLPIPLPDSGPVGECVGCLQENCGDQINSCYNDPNCVEGIQCAITQCFAGGGNPQGGNPPGGGIPGGGGGLDFACLLGCFGGDPTAVFAAVQTFQCITQTCGSSCGGGLLGDGGFPLGGLGGGPGPGPGPGVHALPGGQYYIDNVRVPFPAEVPGYPQLQQALSRLSRLAEGAGPGRAWAHGRVWPTRA